MRVTSAEPPPWYFSTRWNCHSGLVLSSGVEACWLTKRSSSRFAPRPGSADRRTCQSRSKSASSSQNAPAAVSTVFWRKRGYARKRVFTSFLSCSRVIVSSNIITLVIIIRLVARSMRSHAVSTRDIGSRRFLALLPSAIVVPAVILPVHPDVASRWSRKSNPAVPLVAQVFPVAAVAAAKAVERGDQVDADQVLGLLVAQLALQAHAQGCAVRDVQHLVV